MADPERNPNSTPENSQGGIEIVLPNMDNFYEFVRDKLHKIELGYEKELELPLSRTSIGDSEFDHEETYIEVWDHTTYNWATPTTTRHFRLFTRLVHSREKVLGGNLGYYNKETQDLIHQTMRKNTFTDSNKVLGHHIGLLLGYYDKNEEVEKTTEYWKRQHEEPEIGSLSGREYQRKLAEHQRGQEEFNKSLDNLKNQALMIYAGGYRSGGLAGFEIPNQNVFTDILHTYVEFYKLSLEAIYKTQGLPVPNLKINFSIPEILPEIQGEKIQEKAVPTKTKEKKSERGGFEAVAGQDEAITEAKKLVQALKHPEIYQKRGVKIPKGILLYGPPGTGKTMLAKAIAKESGVNFMEVSIADIGSKWHGESEKMMQEVFGRAGSNGKTILFFDEFDSLVPPRDDAYEVTRKIIAVFNQNMDGIRANPNVTVIAATNRPEGVDLAAKRSGRFDKIIEMGLPNEKGRVEIFKKHMEKAIKASTEPDNLFAQDLDFNRIARETNGFSGADLANLVNRVLEDKLSAELEGKVWTSVTTNEVLDMAYNLSIKRSERIEVQFNKR